MEISDVRFTPESGHVQRRNRCLPNKQPPWPRDKALMGLGWKVGTLVATFAMAGDLFSSVVKALKQIWLYILAPLMGAGVAGYLFRSGLLAAETVIPMRGEGESEVPPRRRHRVILGAGDARSSPQAVRAKNGSEPIWRLPHSRKSPLLVKSGH